MDTGLSFITARNWERAHGVPGCLPRREHSIGRGAEGRRPATEPDVRRGQAWSRDGLEGRFGFSVLCPQNRTVPKSASRYLQKKIFFPRFKIRQTLFHMLLKTLKMLRKPFLVQNKVWSSNVIDEETSLINFD